MQVNIDRIQVNSGRREALPDAVRELADSISAVGLLNPITVDRDYILIAGLHRLEAAKLLGWAEIECNVSSLEGLQAELAEIDENFVRADLETLEFGKLLLRRKEIYEMLHPQVKNGGDRKSEKIKRAKCALDSVPSFIEDTAEKLSVHPATVRREIQTAKNLTAEAKTILRDSDAKLTKKDALKLSRLPPEQQEDAATQLAAGDIRSVDEYHPTHSEQPETPIPAPAPQATEGCYPTIKASVDDLKNPDKDRRRTPDTFLMTFSFFLQKFCAGVANYSTPEHEAIFPALTQEQLEQLRVEIQSVHTALDGLYHKIERKARQ